LLVLGPGVEMSDRLDTLSKRPLHGRRILITRARHQVDPFRRELVDLGAAVVEIPTLEIRRLPTDDRVRNAIKTLDRTALVIFASANAVDIFFQMLVTTGLDARAFHNSKLCAIGQETADALASHGLRPELVTSEYTADGLANALAGLEMQCMRVLVPRAGAARGGGRQAGQRRSPRRGPADVPAVHDAPAPRGRQACVELLVMGVLGAVILASGLLIRHAIGPAVPAGLANGTTQPQVAPHE